MQHLMSWLRKCGQRLEDRGMVVRVSVYVPHRSVLAAVVVMGVILLLPWAAQVNSGIGTPTSGMVEFAALTAGLFGVVVCRRRGSARQSVDEAGYSR